MKISTLSIVFGMAGVALGGCKIQNYDSSACAGFLGCSAGSQIGIPPVAPASDAAAGEVGSLHAINQGCGKPLPDDQVHTVVGKPTGYTHYTVMGTGATLLTPIAGKAGARTFWVRVPQNYDPTKKYRTVYLGQGCGGYNVANTSTYQLYREDQGGTEQAIYVALDIPTDHANMDCYDNRDGPSSQEWEAFQLIHTVVDSTYCVDNDRVYVSGYSTGGWLQNMWGCYFAGDGLHPWNGKPGQISTLTSRANSVSDAGLSDGPMSLPGDDASTGVDGGGGAAGTGGGEVATFPDGPVYVPTAGQRKFAPEYHVRAQAGVSGGEPDNNPPCNGPVAAFWLHDLLDPNAYSANHTDALDRVLRMNGCFSNNPPTAPWHEDVLGKGVCVEYTACPAAYPVVFCTTNMYGHGAQDARAVPGFNLFFNELESHMTP